jgi:tRNA dimethylallyltransferase
MTPAPLIAVLGPTASGKSDLALALCEHFNGEIVNCDSLQLYRYMDVGTAKTPPAERRGIPHHLMDIIDPDQVFTAGAYIRLARETLRCIAERGRVPVVAGGTGFYFRALIDGLFPGPGADERIRARLARRPEQLHRLLERIDPKAAARIHPNDIKKIIRAIEVCIIARRRVSEIQSERDTLTGFTVFRIGLSPPRQLLSERIDFRCQAMFDHGIIDETHKIVELFGRSAKALEAIGYAEALQVLDGILTPAQAVSLAQTKTRQYAKRQLTWFRKEPATTWLRNFGNQEQTIMDAIGLVNNFVKISG